MRKKLFYIFLLPLFIFSCNKSKPVIEEKITITLDPNGGIISKNKMTFTKGTVYYDGIFPTPTKDKYVFSYWSYPNDEDIPIDKTYTMSEDATIKAQYVEAIKVSFDTDGGTTMDPKFVGKGTLFSNSLFDTPTKVGYTFTNWTINDEQIPDVYEITEDITLKAKYKKADEESLSDDEKYIKNMNISKITNYLYSVTCNDVNYEIAEKYFNTKNAYIKTAGKVGCSSVYQNGFAGHNFDLNYSTIPEFIVKTTKSNNRFASLGVAFNYYLNDNHVNTTQNMNGHKVMPFVTFDGVNENGFFVCLNEVPSIDKEVGRVIHTDSTKPKMNTINIVRYLLDNAKDVEDAERLMGERDFFTQFTNELHYLVADSKGNSAVIEFKKVTDNDSDIIFYKLGNSEYKGIMTNFTFNDYKGDASNYKDENSSLTLHAEGVERYNILYEAMFSDKTYKIKSLDDVLDLLKKVYYTITYTKKPTDKEFWFTEFNYDSKHTKITAGDPNSYDSYLSLLNGYLKYYTNKTRLNSYTGGFYMTRHSVAYDLNNLTMKIIFEENINEPYSFSLLE